MPASAAEDPNAPKSAIAKRRKLLKHEKVYLDNMPSADRYYSVFAVLIHPSPSSNPHCSKEGET